MGSVNNNKEFFELLNNTDSNSGSEIQQLVIPPRKKRFRRRLRNNPNTRHEQDEHFCHCKARSVSLTVFCLVLMCWLITLTWLAVVLHQEMFRLNTDFDQMVAAHKGVPDALQECHSLSRELHKNQSAIITRLAGISLLMGNFSANLSDVQVALAAVQEQLKTSPSLVNDPRLVKDLSESVAKFGSKIQDLETTSTSLKDQDSHQDTVIASLVANLTDVHKQVASLASDRGGVSAGELIAQRESIMKTIGQLIVNVTSINETLVGKLKWTADDEAEDHKKVENLREMNENITARLQTLEGLCLNGKTGSVAVPATVAASPVPAPDEAEAVVTPKHNSAVPALFTTRVVDEAGGDKVENNPSAQKLSAPNTSQ